MEVGLFQPLLAFRFLEKLFQHPQLYLVVNLVEWLDLKLGPMEG